MYEHDVIHTTGNRQLIVTLLQKDQATAISDNFVKFGHVETFPRYACEVRTVYRRITCIHTYRQTDRQTEWNDNKAHSLLCERDATDRQTDTLVTIVHSPIAGGVKMSETKTLVDVITHKTRATCDFVM